MMKTCVSCKYRLEQLTDGEPCTGCFNGSLWEPEPNPEIPLADCLKQIAESIENMAKLQNAMNDMMHEFILTNMRLSDSIIFANKKLDKLSEALHTLHQKVDPDITWNCEVDGPTLSSEYLKKAADFVKEDQDEGSEEAPV